MPATKYIVISGHFWYFLIQSFSCNICVIGEKGESVLPFVKGTTPLNRLKKMPARAWVLRLVFS